MTPKERKAFEAWAGKRERASTTSAWDYALKAWQAATLAARERVTAAEQASRYEADLCQQALERVKVLEAAAKVADGFSPSERQSYIEYCPDAIRKMEVRHHE